MSVDLPVLPALTVIKPRLLSWNTNLRPPLGGAEQRIQRLGSRYQIDVALPRLSEKDARAFVAARLRSEAEATSLILTWPKVPDPKVQIGHPLVHNPSGTQSGTSLIGNGFHTNVVIPAMSPFSVTVSGRYYLYYTSAEVQAASDGTCTLPIAPMLRAGPAENEPINFDTPKIQGFVDSQSVDWDVDLMRTYGLSFTMTEAR